MAPSGQVNGPHRMRPGPVAVSRLAAMVEEQLQQRWSPDNQNNPHS
jgi:hypothetical protein